MYTNRLRPETAHSPSCRAPSNSTAKATGPRDRKSTRLNSSHSQISYAVFCLKKKINPAFAPPSPPSSPAYDKTPNVSVLGLDMLVVSGATGLRIYVLLAHQTLLAYSMCHKLA